MSKGPLGFPRLTGFGPFTSSSGEDINDRRLKESVSTLDTDFRIQDSKGNNPYPKWDRVDTRTSGVSGFWIKNEDLMVIEPRSSRLSKTHADMALNLNEQYTIEDLQIIPWSSVKSRDSILADEGWFLDVNSTAGSMEPFGGPDFSEARTQATLNDMWPIIYTAWLTDHPHKTTVTYNYTDLEEYKDETFVLANGYREMSFHLGGLPEAKVNRTG